MIRTIATMDTGNVIVVEHCAGGNAREFCRRGPCVYEVSADGSKAPAYAGLTTGEPLVIRRGESLEDAIRRTLAPAKPGLVERMVKRFRIFG